MSVIGSFVFPLVTAMDSAVL
ncbi:hypothetical protein CP061683_0304A, partial [Chlamydia psittaci 06-1683]